MVDPHGTGRVGGEAVAMKAKGILIVLSSLGSVAVICRLTGLIVIPSVLVLAPFVLNVTENRSGIATEI
jgi:hypothetical protein